MSSIAQMAEAPRQGWDLAYPPYSEQHFAFCNAFASHVANSYLRGEMDFDLADRAMIQLYSYSYHDDDRGMPELAWAIYNAFDAGEYHHPSDSSHVDPEEKYTRAALIALMPLMESGSGVNG